MGGEATYSGTTYQAKLIAHVYAHMLAQSRLHWLDSVDDTPLGVSGETGGPGDDVRVEFANSGAFEVQAKHGLSGGRRLEAFVSGLVSHADQRVRASLNDCGARARDRQRLSRLRARRPRLHGLEPAPAVRRR